MFSVNCIAFVSKIKETRANCVGNISVKVLNYTSLILAFCFKIMLNNKIPWNVIY
jgi:hypothetical protein